MVASCGAGGALGPELPERTKLGYQCTDDSPCGYQQKCYKRYPGSVGRCVHEAYWETADRGCANDMGCLATEVCLKDPGELLGLCAQRYGYTVSSTTSPPLRRRH